jgi:hypothetical protein
MAFLFEAFYSLDSPKVASVVMSRSFVFVFLLLLLIELEALIVNNGVFAVDVTVTSGGVLRETFAVGTKHALVGNGMLLDTTVGHLTVRWMQPSIPPNTTTKVEVMGSVSDVHGAVWAGAPILTYGFDGSDWPWNLQNEPSVCLWLCQERVPNCGT